MPHSSQSRYAFDDNKICNTARSQVFELIEGSSYIVESQSQPGQFWNVNMKNGFCECPQGSSRGPCKHKAAVHKYFKVAEFSILPSNDNRIKAMYHFIAVGKVMDPDHYCGLSDDDTAENLDNFVEQHLPSNTSVTSPSEPSGHTDQSNQMDEDNALNAEEEEEKEKYWQMHMKNMTELTKQMLDENWADESFRKAFIMFTKRYKKAVSSNQNTFVSSLYTFGKDKKMKNSRHIPLQTTAIQRRKQKEKGLGRRPAMPGRKDNLGHVDADDVEEIEELNLEADQFINANANLEAGRDCEDQEELNEDDLDEEVEVESDDDKTDDIDNEIHESDGDCDGDNNMHQQTFYQPPAFTPKKRKLRHSLSEAVSENRNNAR